MSYALVRIKNGSKVFQDFKVYTWPPSQYEGGADFAGVKDNQIFIGHKQKPNDWYLYCDGAGSRRKYGNGAIHVRSYQIEILTCCYLREDALIKNVEIKNKELLEGII